MRHPGSLAEPSDWRSGHRAQTDLSGARSGSMAQAEVSCRPSAVLLRKEPLDVPGPSRHGQGGAGWVCRPSQIPELQKNTDGSIDIYFGPQAAGKDSNWVPTDPARKFELMFRAYAPIRVLFDKTWVLPDVERVAAR